MLKLKYLFDNPDLAQMIAKNWNGLSTPAFFRTSSNAIYTVTKEGKIFFLRFSPQTEKSINSVIAEVEFIMYLKDSGFNACTPVPSKNFNLQEDVDTPWGKYTAVLFPCNSGVQLSEVKLDAHLSKLMGKTLGILHELSCQYTPKNCKRKSHDTILNDTSELAQKYRLNDVLTSVKIIQEELGALPKDIKNYGLIHYDFETDNLFIDSENQNISVIDFDDSHYNWYALDIERALNNILEQNGDNGFNDLKSSFMDGYFSVRPIDERIFERLPLLTAYANLYGYIRIYDSLFERWNNEPEWMGKLRNYINSLLNERKKVFVEYTKGKIL